ncbi:uncharacterized protein OCT59_026198 [Rhizophagus irregularis]|uniref:uncharacterized protein n=1 Tax=Rhizophagus irregularis TaxID=588596 RepID=UPI0033183C86|nr:hypothetical protein OCT59_026198 [Rhizophagus irregularis]
MLDRLPVEIVERIVAKIPDTDLIAASKVDSVWWQEREIDWITFEDVNDFYKRWIDRLTKNQLYIMGKMLRNGMVVDPQERETIEYALSEQKWGGDPWGLGVDGLELGLRNDLDGLNFEKGRLPGTQFRLGL